MEQKFYLERFNDGSWKNFQGFLSALDGLSYGRWVITVTKYKKKRSLSQNAYYHGCVIPAVKDGLIDMGFDASLLSNENVHELLKNKFLKEDVGNESGEFITLTKSTTELSTVQFMDFIAEIQMWASTFLGIVIADPNTQAEMF